MTIPSLLAFLVPLLGQLVPSPAHPHHPYVIPVACQHGKVTLRTMTVPFNAEHLKSLKPGFAWHLGYSMLEVGVPLTSGGVSVPAGNYMFEAVINDRGSWDVRLQDRDYSLAKRRVQSAERRPPRGVRAEQMLDEAKKTVAAAEQAGRDKAIVLPMQDFEAKHAEHLEVRVLLEGYTALDRREWQPRGGTRFAVQVSFGDLHRRVGFEERIPGAAKDGDK